MGNVETLYRAHFTELCNWFRGQVKNADDAADLAQDVFLQLSLKEADGGEVSKAYMWKAARGRLSKFRRKPTESPLDGLNAHIVEGVE